MPRLQFSLVLPEVKPYHPGSLLSGQRLDHVPPHEAGGAGDKHSFHCVRALSESGMQGVLEIDVVLRHGFAHVGQSQQ